MLTETMLFGKTPTVTDFLSSEIFVSMAAMVFVSVVSMAVEELEAEGPANSILRPVVHSGC